jgi:hypothetical protein
MRSITLVSLTAVALAGFGGYARADDALDQLQRANQAQFRLISEDLGSALSYKSLTPAEPLGALGFDIDIEVTATSVKNRPLIEQVSSSSIPSTVPVPKLHVHKGLPGGFDVGLSYSAVPSLGVSLIGGELRYAILEGTAATPAVSVRGSFSKLSGVDQLKFDTKAIDISVSKGFLNFTPYAGIGQVWVDSNPQNVPLLNKESFTQTKVFAGANVNFGLANLLFEVDQTGKAVSYGAKLGFRF